MDHTSSETPTVLSESIAERSFEASGLGGIARSVNARFGKPEQDGDDWRCPIQITGIGDESVTYAYGVDALQAFLLGLQKADALLRHEAKQQGLTIKWLGGHELWMIPPLK